MGCSMKEAHRNIQPFHTKAVECTIRKIIDRLRAERHIAGDRGTQTCNARRLSRGDVRALRKSLIPLMTRQDESWPIAFSWTPGRVTARHRQS